MSKAIRPWVWKVLVKHANEQNAQQGNIATIRQDTLLEEVADMVKEFRPWLVHRNILTLSHVLTACVKEYECKVLTDTVEYMIP